MDDVQISGEVFARMVGKAGDVFLFEVARKFIDEAGGAEATRWSGPVEYRFIRSASGYLDMQFRIPASELWCD